jgi:hypothetical protein
LLKREKRIILDTFSGSSLIDCSPTVCASVAAEARSTGWLQNSNDLAREAVGYNGLFGGSLRHFRFAFARES